MRKTALGAVACVLFLVADAAAQTTSMSGKDFLSAPAADRADILRTLIVHESKLDPASRLAVLRAALTDTAAAASERDMALAAVVTGVTLPLVGGQQFAESPAWRDAWVEDYASFRSLRPFVQANLAHVNERVRDRAVAALASLDMDAQSMKIVIAPQTEQVLVDHFRSEPTPGVRARIVAGFGSGPGAVSDAVQALIGDALADADPRVRHAAIEGVTRLYPTTAVALLTNMLADPDRSVRSEAAANLPRLKVDRSAYLPALYDALNREVDGQGREALRRAIVAAEQ